MEKPDTRSRVLADAVTAVEVTRNNRTKWIERNEAKGKAAAIVKRSANKALSLARRAAWEEWRERREFARKMAVRGKYLLPPATHGPGTRACCGCGTQQPGSSFAPGDDVCSTCHSQVDWLSAALAAERAARVRARKKMRLGVVSATVTRAVAPP